MKSEVIRMVTTLMTLFRVLTTLLVSTHEPPSKAQNPWTLNPKPRDSTSFETPKVPDIESVCHRPFRVQGLRV